MGEAIALTRQMIERWNADDFENVFATWDRDIVVRLDPEHPDRTCFGAESARRFWEGQRESMGLGQLQAEEELDLGNNQCLVRVTQPVHSRSGFESAYDWSMIVTAREGRVVMIEFFIDAERGRAALAR
jgi:ketosteroid isomerase-like protein